LTNAAHNAAVSRMDELVQLVVSKTGISEPQARSAVETVVGFLKARLPAPLAGHVDSALGFAAQNLGGKDVVDGLASSLGGLFGKKD
jgi:hypothetical protein